MDTNSKADQQRRPDSFQHYVFWSMNQDPTAIERSTGVYLLDRADAHYLARFFSPLYESTGLGLSPSSDQLVSGEALDALQRAVNEAIEEVGRKPGDWPVVVGRTFEPFQQQLGAPIVEQASRRRLLQFLRSVITMISKARDAGGYLHFGGGE